MSRWGRQVFLNEPWEGDSGAVVCHVDLRRHAHHTSLDASVLVWDCDRKVRLEFDVNGSKSIQQRRKKVDRFEQVTQMFVKKYRAALDQAEKDMKDE